MNNLFTHFSASVVFFLVANVEQPKLEIKIFYIPFDSMLVSPTSVYPGTLGGNATLILNEKKNWTRLHSLLTANIASNTFQTKEIRVVIIGPSGAVFYVDKCGIVKFEDLYYRIDPVQLVRLFKSLGYKGPQE